MNTSICAKDGINLTQFFLEIKAKDKIKPVKGFMVSKRIKKKKKTQTTNSGINDFLVTKT